jgi:hypothetical protein
MRRSLHFGFFLLSMVTEYKFVCNALMREKCRKMGFPSRTEAVQNDKKTAFSPCFLFVSALRVIMQVDKKTITGACFLYEQTKKMDRRRTERNRAPAPLYSGDRGDAVCRQCHLHESARQQDLAAA